MAKFKELLPYLVVAGLALIVIGTQRENIAALAQMPPVVIVAVAGGLCLVTVVLVAWRGRDPQSWKKYGDVVVTGAFMLVALVGGLYLTSAATVYADEPIKAAAARTAAGWSLSYFAAGFLMGFLFGIPRVSQGVGTNRGAAPTAYEGDAGATLFIGGGQYAEARAQA